MQKNKEIGKIFKDKFENFEVSPDVNMWEKISLDLDERKQKKRILPFYFYVLSGIMTLISIFIYFQSENTFDTNENKSIQDKSHVKKDEHISNTSKNSFSNIQSIKNDKIKGVTIKSEVGLKNAEDINYLKEKNLNCIDSSNSWKTLGNEKIIDKKLLKESSIIQKQDSHTKIKNFSSEDLDKLSTSTRKKKKYSRTVKVVKISNNKTEIEVVEKYIITIDKINNKTSVKKATKKTNNNKTNLSVFKGSNIKSKSSHHVIKKKKRPIKKTKYSQYNDVRILDKEKDKGQKQSSVIEEVIKSEIDTSQISKKHDKINEDKLKTSKINLVKKQQVQPKENKKLSNKKKSEYVEDFLFRFGIQPTIGLNLIGNYKNGSMIGSSFDKQNSSSKLTFSYGMYFVFDVMNKISLRTGIMKNRIVAETDLNNYSGNFSDVNFSSSFNFNLLNNFNGSRIKQEIDYYEIPVEALYTIKDYDDISFDLIVGTSLNFKKSNDLTYITSSEKEYTLGSSNKISNANLTFNVGLNARYKLNDDVSIIVNPMFRSMLGIPEDKFFNTYQVSLQSGLLYKF